MRFAQFTAVCVVAWCLAAPSALAVYGDQYGFAEAPQPNAIPGPDAFWAGTCDLASAPAVGQDILGGYGARPPEVVNGITGGPALPVFASAPSTPIDCIDPGVPTITREVEAPWSTVPSWRLPAIAQAGARADGSAILTIARDHENQSDAPGGAHPAGSTRDILAMLPPGFVGNPAAVPRCTNAEFESSPPQCPPESQVGVLNLRLNLTIQNIDEVSPVYNLEPLPGRVAELGVPNVGSGLTTVRIVAKARTDGDFGVIAGVERIPTGAPLLQQSLTIWGVPWAASHDPWRIERGTKLSSGVYWAKGLDPANQAPYDPSWGPIKPFLSNPTGCGGAAPTTTIFADSWQNPAATLANGEPDLTPDPGNPLAKWIVASSESPAVTDCEQVAFDPDIAFDPGARAADAPAGLDVDLTLPQNNDPPPSVANDPDDAAGAPSYWKSAAAAATAHLKDTEVLLPEGVSLNPSAATGLAACSTEQIGFLGAGFPAPNPIRFDNSDPDDGRGSDCPEASKIGTVVVETPLLEEEDWPAGVVYVAAQGDNPFGSDYAIYIAVESPRRGLIAKLAGRVEPDPVTGRLKTTFADNPQLPFNRLRLKLKAGVRAPLATPPRCGSGPAYRSVSTFLPWSRAHLPAAEQAPAVVDQDWTVDQDCGFGFAPVLTAGMSTPAARAHGRFSFEFTRPQGDQPLRGLTATLPAGLLASVKDVPLCSSAQAEAGDCPAGSRIGTVDASAGSGDPFVLEQKGEAFLTEGYKGGEYGLAVKVRAVGGPFDLGTIVVRQAIHVDRETARVTAVSDPFPLILKGVPLRVRRVLVRVDRERFMLNPSDCSSKQVGATILSAEGTQADVASHFQASGCAGLPFEPKLALRLTGRRQVTTGKHPGVRAIVTQAGIGEAGIEKAEVRLPKSLALDPDNAQALCEFADGTKDDLENHCPKGSIVGRARATSPLLNDPLVGNVYFVKNIRTDAKTGNQIRTLPMIVVALRGEIAVNLKGKSSTTRSGKLVNTFASVPDAPVSKFNLNVNGGKNGILAVTRTRRSTINLCSGRHIAEADMAGKNGRRHDFDVRMKTPCTKRQTKAAKRKAKRAAAKRAAARRAAHRR